MTLTFVDPTDQAPRLIVLLYGPEGARKTTGAASAPDPNVYLNADRKDGLAFARKLFPGKDLREVRVTGLDSLHETIFYVREHPGEIKTVTVDTIGRTFDLVLRSMAKDDKHPTTPEIGNAQTEIERFIETLIEDGVNIVLVAHDMTVETKGSDDDGTLLREQMPMCGTSKPSFPRKLMRHVSVVAYCGVVGEGEQRRGVAQLRELGGRRAKDNTGALDTGEDGVRDVDLTEWAAAIEAFYAPAASPAGGTDKTKSKES